MPGSPLHAGAPGPERPGTLAAGRRATERQLEQIASKAGELILNGADYWPALVLAADRVLARER